MNINRRKFLAKSILLGGSVAGAGYVLSNTSPTIKQVAAVKANNLSAGYQNTRHNRQFYQTARF